MTWRKKLPLSLKVMMFCGWFVQSLPWVSSAVPGVALGAAGQSLSALESLCSSPADLPGILQSQSSRNSVPGNRAALPRLSCSIILPCSTACMGLSLAFRAEWAPGGTVYDDAVGQKVSKALGLGFARQCSDRSASCTDRFDTLLTKR